MGMDAFLETLDKVIVLLAEQSRNYSRFYLLTFRALINRELQGKARLVKVCTSIIFSNFSNLIRMKLAHFWNILRFEH